MHEIAGQAYRFRGIMTKKKGTVMTTTTVIDTSAEKPNCICGLCHRVGHRQNGQHCELRKKIEAEEINPVTGKVYTACSCWHDVCGGCGIKDRHTGKSHCENPTCPEKSKAVVGRAGSQDFAFMKKW